MRRLMMFIRKTIKQRAMDQHIADLGTLLSHQLGERDAIDAEIAKTAERLALALMRRYADTHYPSARVCTEPVSHS